MENSKIFHKSNKNFNNNTNIYYGKSSQDIDNSKNIYQKINDIFSSPSFVYKANVEIVLKDKNLIKRIIGRNKDFLITMDNDLIPIKDILDIKSIKK